MHYFFFLDYSSIQQSIFLKPALIFSYTTSENFFCTLHKDAHSPMDRHTRTHKKDDLPRINPPEFCGNDSWRARGTPAPNQNLSMLERESLWVKLRPGGRKRCTERQRDAGRQEAWITTGLYHRLLKPAPQVKQRHTFATQSIKVQTITLQEAVPQARQHDMT